MQVQDHRLIKEQEDLLRSGVVFSVWFERQMNQFAVSVEGDRQVVTGWGSTVEEATRDAMNMWDGMVWLCAAS